MNIKTILGVLGVLLVSVGAVAPSFAQEAPSDAEAWGRDQKLRDQAREQADALIRREFIQSVEALGEQQEDFASKLSVLDVAPADLAWVQATMRTLQAEETAVDAGEFLSSPSLQLSYKLLADVVSQPYSGSKSLVPNSADFNNALVQHFGQELGPYMSLHGAVPQANVDNLLWLAAATQLDEIALQDDSLTAQDLLSRPEYLLARKIAADTMVEAMTNCVRCSDPSASYYVDPLCGPSVGAGCAVQYQSNVRGCDISYATCRLVPFRPCERIRFHCMCVAACVQCHCEAGTVPYDCFHKCSLNPNGPCLARLIGH